MEIRSKNDSNIVHSKQKKLEVNQYRSSSVVVFDVQATMGCPEYLEQSLDDVGARAAVRPCNKLVASSYSGVTKVKTE